MKTTSSRILVLLVGAFALFALYWGNPENDGWWLKCPLYQLTGWQCPLCGSQRAVHAFLHGCWSEAWHYNPGLWLFLPYGLLLLAGSFSSRLRQTWLLRRCYDDRVMLLCFLFALGWGLARNLCL